MGAKTRQLVLVRHGETDSNDAGRFLGRSDPALNSRGKLQAAALQPMVSSYDPTHIVCSPLIRAQSTAEAACGKRLHCTIDERLKELDFGDWEGLTQAQARQRDPDHFHQFDVGNIGAFPGGDDITETAGRIRSVVEDRAGERVLFVTHATWIRVAVASLLKLDTNQYRSLLGRPENGSWTELRSSRSAWKLVRYNCVFPTE